MEFFEICTQFDKQSTPLNVIKSSKYGILKSSSMKRMYYLVFGKRTSLEKWSEIHEN